MNDTSRKSGETVRLAERRIFSKSFRELYSTGMTLVEDAAGYLDGEGRIAARQLDRLPATLYAAEVDAADDAADADRLLASPSACRQCR